MNEREREAFGADAGDESTAEWLANLLVKQDSTGTSGGLRSGMARAALGTKGDGSPRRNSPYRRRFQAPGQ